MSNSYLEFSNGELIPRKEIPKLSIEVFHQEALYLIEKGGKIVQYFAYLDDNAVKLIAILRTNKLFVAECESPPEIYPSLTQHCEPFHMFEREIAEQYGMIPKDHPWLKMVRYHPNYRNRPDVFGNQYHSDIPGNYNYYQVEGEEIHEVAVGPVHAGVIEPGHFRFNCIGERVLNLEIQLGYQHRGIEMLFPVSKPKQFPILAEGIAGDTAVANCLCMSQAIEALTMRKPDTGAKIIRTIALELERIANHVGDLGALSGDVAFLPAANYFGRMRGDFLNLSQLLGGSRFGKGLVRPGGVEFSLSDEDRYSLSQRLAELKPQVTEVIDLLFDTHSVRARFIGCGSVNRSDAEKLGLVGPAGRASGIAYDVRRSFPTESYYRLTIPEKSETTGDVFARAKVRADEIHQSIRFIQHLLNETIHTRCVKDGVDSQLARNSFVATLNEAWRGELSHCILTDNNGEIIRYKIKDPSFHNWSGLSMALRNTGISDFPLNNKSFNLSYCGFDL